MRYLNYARYLVSKYRANPVYLVHFLTNNCNANCPHCLRTGLPDLQGKELSYDEIIKFTQQLENSIYSATLTGGEALLRKDIGDIVTAYLQNTNIKTLQILSNGSLPEKAAVVAKRVAPKFPNKKISFELSLDGIGSDHDSHRGISGLFEKVVETYWTVKSLAKQFPNLNAGLNLTMSAANQDTILDVYKYAVKELKADLLTITLIRGDVLDQRLKILNFKNYEELCRVVEKELKTADTARKGKQNLFSLLITAQDIITRRRIIKTIQKQAQIGPCYAGVLSGVVFSNGDVGPCELLDKKIGNLRNHDYNMASMWKSDKAISIRKEIKETRCYCTYECSMLCNVLFNPNYLPLLLKKTMDLWLSQRLLKPGLE